jgi:hypothetical protein
MNPKEQRFLKFHADNPHVYALFDRFTREAVDSGTPRYSAYAIVNRIRWHTTIETVGTAFRVPNDHIPYLARLWLRQNPQHAGFFVIHALKYEKYPVMDLEPVTLDVTLTPG